MGNDGGSIPDRRDLVKNKPKAEQADKMNQTRARWEFCALSKKPLQEPIVSCRLGRLYNKDALIEFLLDGSSYGDGNSICGHIKSLKDVKVLSLTPNPSKRAKLSDTDRATAKFICSLSMKEMNGSVPFVYLYPCGCVFSESGLKTVVGTPSILKGNTPVESERLLCPQCGAKYKPGADVYPINPDPDEETILFERLATDLAAGKVSKKQSGSNTRCTRKKAARKFRGS